MANKLVSISVANYSSLGVIQITQNNTVMGTVSAAQSSIIPTIGTVNVMPGVAISIQGAPNYYNVCNVAAANVVAGLFIQTNVPWGNNACPCDNNVQSQWPSNWPTLFTGSVCGDEGTVGCTQNTPDGKPGGTCNPNWLTYTTITADSIAINAGGDCRTICTNNLCNFLLGTGGVTQITFDFEVVNYTKSDGNVIWLAFWIYCKAWQNTQEVDFIESRWGPGVGLNSNFAGQGDQVVIYPGSATGPWKGSITANFSTNPNGTIAVSVSNSVNSKIGTATLAGPTGSETGYFFVLNTCPTDQSDCTITISNLNVVGSWQGTT